ncbi:MAG: preprotein translocase subunit SecY [Bacteroidetes bacterium]|nr:preprotein translocase subunit SecY [Bacteroidota bacterium]
MNLWQKIKTAFTDKFIRRKIIFVLFILAVFRLLAVIPIPGVDTFRLQGFLEDNQFLNLLNIFSGGGLSALSIVMMGVGPYITGSIIMQLLTLMSPRLKSMYQEEGTAGRMKFSQYGRILTVPLAMIQGYALITILAQQGIVKTLTSFEMAIALIVTTAGSLLLTWLGELISEKGVGNGVSVIIFAGIVVSMPAHIRQLIFTYDQTQLLSYIGFLIVGILLIAGVVYITEAERLLPITHARQARAGGAMSSSSSYLPLRINMAGVMPVIFALSILMFPQVISQFFAASANPTLQSIAQSIAWFLQTTWLYSIVYFILVFLFTYFYTAVTFDPESVATNLQKNGAFVPGIRPGASTTEYIGKIVSRVTLIGAVFLGIIAVLPVIMRQITGISSLAIGGTAVLIVVSVIIDILKKVDGQVSMRQY